MQNIKYTIRESDRATRVRLSFCIQHGLVVIVPRGFDQKLVPALVAGKEDWITRTAVKLQARAKERVRLKQELATLPKSIHLPSIEKTWEIEYTQHDQGHIRIREQANTSLNITGPIAVTPIVHQALCMWLRLKAEIFLEPWLWDMAKKYDFTIKKVRIGMARTLWGSCSSKATINLNARLLFLPPALVEHILLHELCHTKQRNHGKDFWLLVQSYDPKYKENMAEIRTASSLVPAWAK